MELSSPQQRYHHYTLPHHTSLPSPTSSSSSSSNNNNGVRSPGPGGPNSGPLPSPTTPTVTRSDPSNPYPTTFVQADTTSFKQVVQMLTGSSEPIKPASKPNHHNHHPIPPIKPSNKSRPSTKLYERRNNSLKHLRISPLLPTPAGYSPRHPTNIKQGEMLSPSMLDFPSLVLSPVTPLIHDPFNRSSPVSSNCSPNIIDHVAEQKAIAEKGFFLHPVSPAPEPRLLPLFPVTSPKVSSSDNHLTNLHHHATC